mgnify:CR=1 FL=1
MRQCDIVSYRSLPIAERATELLRLWSPQLGDCHNDAARVAAFIPGCEVVTGTAVPHTLDYPVPHSWNRVQDCDFDLTAEANQFAYYGYIEVAVR